MRKLMVAALVVFAAEGCSTTTNTYVTVAPDDAGASVDAPAGEDAGSSAADDADVSAPPDDAGSSDTAIVVVAPDTRVEGDAGGDAAAATDTAPAQDTAPAVDAPNCAEDPCAAGHFACGVATNGCGSKRNCGACKLWQVCAGTASYGGPCFNKGTCSPALEQDCAAGQTHIACADSTPLYGCTANGFQNWCCPS